jgi:arylformamidase
MTVLYRGMDRAALDAAYNNSLAVANSGELMAWLELMSEQARRMPQARIGLRYGPKARNLIDYFPAEAPGPVVVFIHGGYWQMRAKVEHGVHVALVGYTLAPEAGLAAIVDEVRASVRWLHANAGALGGQPDRLVLSGWSAGGHLTAMCMEETGVVAGLCISGIYQLEPIRLSYLNDRLGLTRDDVPSLSPSLLPLSGKPMVIAYGEAELPELQSQSQEFFRLRQAAGAPGSLRPQSGCNHFTILTQLADRDGELVTALKDLCASAI